MLCYALLRVVDAEAWRAKRHRMANLLFLAVAGRHAALGLRASPVLRRNAASARKLCFVGRGCMGCSSRGNLPRRRGLDIRARKHCDATNSRQRFGNALPGRLKQNLANSWTASALGSDGISHFPRTVFWKPRSPSENVVSPPLVCFRLVLPGSVAVLALDVHGGPTHQRLLAPSA